MTYGVNWFEKQICNRLFFKKVCDVFTDKDGFISMKVEDILDVE